MNYLLSISLPPVVMFASVSLIEKLLGALYEQKSTKQRNAITAVLSRILTLLVLMVGPLLYILLDTIRHRQLDEYYVDYAMGTIITTNTCALLWTAYANGLSLPVNQIILAYITFYHVISNPHTLLYYASFLITVFSTLRVSEDVAQLYHSKRLYDLNTFIRKAEEVSMYGFFVLNPSKMSMFALAAACLALPWLYSDNIDEIEWFHLINRKSTTLPAIRSAARNHPLLMNELVPEPKPAPREEN